MRWLRGNLHTHTLWSDGDQYPEVVLQWYSERGYDFIALSDHNVLADSERWIPVVDADGEAALAAYRETMGADWIELRTDGAGMREVRLKRFEEFVGRFARPDEFLVMQGEEITDQFDRRPLHVNATNLTQFIPPQGGNSVVEVLQNNVDAILEQRRATGRPMFPHINHPNFGWAVTAEDLMALRGENFFEVYNGHPLVHNDGDSLRPSTERIWDIILSDRLFRGDPMLYGIAVDDSHHYGRDDAGLANPGRGWVMVRATELTPRGVIAALEAGSFYGSSGVRLDDVRASDTALEVYIRGEPGVQYVTKFVGTRVGYDRRTEPVPDIEGLPASRRYSVEIGTIFAEIPGVRPSYTFRGDELYVRARVRSSRRKANPVRPGEPEMAWIQPVAVPRR